MSSPRPAIHPSCAIEGGRITLDGADFPMGEGRLPQVRIGEWPARLVYASSRSIGAVIPAGLEGGRAAVRVEGVSVFAGRVDVAAPLATGLHQVDNPVFDREGNLYVTYSGT